MAEDWLSDVQKYAPNADPEHVAGIVRYCGIALRNRDSSLVSFSSPEERARVRDNFLKKKLALDHDDSTLDAAVSSVGDRMKADRTKNRVTVYYLLAEHFAKLPDFRKASGSKKSAPAAAVPESDRPVAAAGLSQPSSTAASDTAGEPAAADPVVMPRTGAPTESNVARPAAFAGGAPAAGDTPGDDSRSAATGGGFNWWWIVAALIILIILWLIFR
jgi:hypothetical protein